jgi:transposase-like protein
MNLIDVARELGTEEQCFAFLESQRWPDGVRCAVCGCDRISRVTRKTASKNKRAQLYQCLEKTCKQQFSVTSGTIFHDSRIPLTKWFAAIHIIMDAKKGVSALQLQRHLGIASYQTVWHMAHRIRKAMVGTVSADLTGIVEMDETYVGGKATGAGSGWRKRQKELKQVVVGIKQRGGELRLIHAPDAKIETLARYLKDHVSADVEAIMTDELPAYPKALILAGHDEGKHFTVNHSHKVWVDGIATTNGIESAFGLFKRGIVGSFHHVSAKHLHRYLSEFDHRFNRRKMPARFTDLVARSGRTSPLPYRELVGQRDAGAAPDPAASA